MEIQPAPVPYTANKEENFFRKRHNVTVAFGLALLLFLLPFAQLTCGKVMLMGNTGIGIATGSEWKMAMRGNKVLDKVGNKMDQKDARKAVQSGLNIFLLVAIAAGVVGIWAVFSAGKQKHFVTMIAGIICCAMLIAMMIQLKLQVRSAMTESMKKGGSDAEVSSLVKIKFTLWYYLSLLSFAAAAWFSYRHLKIEKEDAVLSAGRFDFQDKKPAETSRM